MSDSIETVVKSHDGVDLVARRWNSAGEPIATVLIVHGLGEHCQRYDAIAKHLASKNLTVLSFDCRGHGKSSGDRGDIRKFEDMMRDIHSVMQSQVQTLPLFLYGHSMGGCQVLHYGLKSKELFPSAAINPIGIVSSAPYLRMAFQPPAWKTGLGRFVGNIFPGLTLDTELNADGLSHDPAVIEEYKKDPLNHSKMSAGFFIASSEAALFNLTNASKFDAPLLLFHGTGDKICCHKASQEFFAAATSSDKTLELLENMYHETHFEPDVKDKVYELVASWITKRAEQFKEAAAAAAISAAASVAVVAEEKAVEVPVVFAVAEEKKEEQKEVVAVVAVEEEVAPIQAVQAVVAESAPVVAEAPAAVVVEEEKKVEEVAVVAAPVEEKKEEAAVVEEKKEEAVVAPGVAEVVASVEEKQEEAAVVEQSAPVAVVAVVEEAAVASVVEEVVAPVVEEVAAAPVVEEVAVPVVAEAVAVVEEAAVPVVVEEVVPEVVAVVEESVPAAVVEESAPVQAAVVEENKPEAAPVEEEEAASSAPVAEEKAAGGKKKGKGKNRR